MTGGRPLGPPDEYDETALGMSNFDGSIDDGLAETLRANPVFARHAGWEFNGRVWWDGGVFREQVWRYHQPIATYSAATLRELMGAVNDAHGWD